MEKLDINTF